MGAFALRDIDEGEFLGRYTGKMMTFDEAYASWAAGRTSGDYFAALQLGRDSPLVVDAENMTLGRLATEIAHRLRGKHKPEYTPHMDMGDYVVVVNCEKIRVTGAKQTDKMYYHHTGFPGGIRSASFEQLIDRAPERVIQRAVKGMMPRSPLGRAMLKKLKVYAGPSHPHAAQQPQPLTI